LVDTIENQVVDLIRRAATGLPADVVDALENAYRSEDSEVARVTLGTILKSVEISRKEGLPLCQDTGSITFYVKSQGPSRYMEDVLFRATARATAEVPLRPNMVEPFTGENSGNNLGALSPFIIWEPADNPGSVQLTVLLKGAGSDNLTALVMLNPTDGVEVIERFVVNRIVDAGGKPCPPTVVGVGIGGSSDIAMFLSKKALLRPIGSRNPNTAASNLERRLLEAINSTGIGPMGLGGRWTSLWVNVECAHRHTASLPVAVSIGCWAMRRATTVISESELSRMEISTRKEV